MTQIEVRPLRTTDQPAWLRLFDGYRDFYEQPGPVPAVVWTWLHDPDHVLRGVVAVLDDEVVGLAHYRAVPRPVHGRVGGYLDDLFVAPHARGRGAAAALLESIRAEGAANGWDGIRWITRSSNTTARALYDRVATATELVTYDMPC